MNAAAAASSSKSNSTLLQPSQPNHPSTLHSSVTTSNNVVSAQNEDLLTQSQPVQPQQQRPIWAVSATTSPIGKGYLGFESIFQPEKLYWIPGILTPTPTNATGNGSAASQNWINSRPNSSSIHTPSPTTAVVPQFVPPPSAAGGSTVAGATAATTGRLPPPLAPTTQPPPSSILPPAYTPPTHTGFQTSPHSSSWRWVISCSSYK